MVQEVQLRMTCLPPGLDICPCTLTDLCYQYLSTWQFTLTRFGRLQCLIEKSESWPPTIGSKKVTLNHVVDVFPSNEMSPQFCTEFHSITGISLQAQWSLCWDPQICQEYRVRQSNVGGSKNHLKRKGNLMQSPKSTGKRLIWVKHQWMIGGHIILRHAHLLEVLREVPAKNCRNIISIFLWNTIYHLYNAIFFWCRYYS